jgi:hypothetical protein
LDLTPGHGRESPRGREEEEEHGEEEEKII